MYIEILSIPFMIHNMQHYDAIQVRFSTRNVYAPPGTTHCILHDCERALLPPLQCIAMTQHIRDATYP